MKPLAQSGQSGAIPRRPLKPAALLLAGILLLATILRLFFLGEKSFVFDEGFSVALARLDGPAFWHLLSHREANASLFFCLLRLWLRLGDSESVIRSLSVIPAVATVPVLYSLGARLFGTRVGLISALLLALNAFHIRYSQEARGYSLLAFLVTLSSYFFLKSIEEPFKKENWAGFILSSVLSLYSHFFAAFVLAAHWVSLISLPRQQVPWRRLLASTALIALLALPLALFVLTRDVGQIAWISRPGLRNVARSISALAGGDGDLLLAACLVFCLMALVAAERLWLRSGVVFEAWHFEFVITWLFVPIILALGISMAKPVFLDRYLIVCLPPFVLLTALGISQLQRRWALGIALGALSILLLRGDYFNYKRVGRYERFDVEDWRASTRFILSRTQPGDALLFHRAYGVLPFEYYWGRLRGFANAATVVLRPGASLLSGVDIDPAPDETALESLPAHYHRVWLVLYPDNDAAARSPIRLSLAAHFRLVDDRRYSGVRVLLYSEARSNRGSRSVPLGFVQ